MYFDCEYLISIYILLLISSDNFELRNQLTAVIFSDIKILTTCM
jgi:hypothetical protein